MAKKEVTLQTLAIADEIIEAKDGKKSVIGIFDKIFVQKLPAAHGQMWVFATLLGEVDKKDKITIRTIRPNEEEGLKLDLDFNFGSEGKANIMLKLQGFPIKEIGTHFIAIERAGKELGRYKLDVLMMKEQDGGTTVN